MEIQRTSYATEERTEYGYVRVSHTVMTKYAISWQFAEVISIQSQYMIITMAIRELRDSLALHLKPVKWTIIKSRLGLIIRAEARQ